MKIEVGQKVYHPTYGYGELLSLRPNGLVLVHFEKEYGMVHYHIIDEPHYFEDRTTLEKTHFIEVAEKELVYSTHCHTCDTHLDSTINQTCEVCGWLKCDCGSCMCNYKGIPRKKI